MNCPTCGAPAHITGEIINRVSQSFKYDPPVRDPLVVALEWLQESRSTVCTDQWGTTWRVYIHNANGDCCADGPTYRDAILAAVEQAREQVEPNL